MTTLQERCRIAEQCLPDAPYRAMLTKLHDEMLAALAQQGEQAKPVAYITDTHQGPMVWTTEMYGEACTYCDDGGFPVPLYTAAPAPQTQEPHVWMTHGSHATRKGEHAEPANSYDLAKRADNGGQP